MPRRGIAAGALLAVIAVVATACSEAPAAESGEQYSSPKAIAAQVRYPSAPREAASTLSGFLSAPGGPYLRDQYSRVVILHGVNAVYKLAPYELTVTPGQPNTFDAADARTIARLGFNVVRLGMLWQGLEPGAGGPNQPAVCTPGAPANPHMYSAATVRAYLAKVAAVVDLLGRYGIYTLLDMHQDVYNSLYRGEGAPAWAVCTDGLPIVALGGRWSQNYHNPTLDIAVAHFWGNDVTGDLQGEYDRVWGAVAHSFADNPWIAGYDPYNEPFSREYRLDDTVSFAIDLECFYTGRARPGRLAADDKPIVCPKSDPRNGVVPTIEAADPHHLVFIEPDIYSIHGKPNLLGPMTFPRLVFNVHSYCESRSPVTGDPTSVDACSGQILASLLRRSRDRPQLTSRAQPGGPAWFLSEFGASSDPNLLEQVTDTTDLLQLGWAYWSWKYYYDPTGSSDEALASPTGALAPTATVLSRTYPQAIDGVPSAYSFDPGSGAFSLTYQRPATSSAPTVIFVARTHYPNGYCATVDGGTFDSPPGAAHLVVDNATGSGTVQVSITAGSCG